MLMKIWEKIVMTLMVISFYSGIAIFGYQVFEWLRTGHWIEMPFSVAFTYIGFDIDWIYHPKNWAGVAYIAQFFLDSPLSVMLPVSMLGVLWFLGDLIVPKT